MRRLGAWLLAFAPASALAADNCSILGIDSSGFQTRCTEPKLSTSAGAALPSFVDGFNFNPAAIPVRPTPIGFEVIASTTSFYSPDPTFNFAVIRGFERFGAAISTNSDNSFYSLSPAQAFVGTGYNSDFLGSASTTTQTSLPAINLGTSFDLSVLLPFANGIPSLGVSAVYNRFKGVWGILTGFAVSSELFSAGLSYLREPASGVFEDESQLRVSVGVGLKIFHLEALYLNTLSGSLPLSAFIVTGSLRIDAFSAYYAWKSYVDVFDEQRSASLVGAQFKIQDRIQIGYLYNYVPSSHSLGAQVLLF